MTPINDLTFTVHEHCPFIILSHRHASYQNKISIANNALVGTIPKQIGSLDDLTNLVLGEFSGNLVLDFVLGCEACHCFLTF